MIARHRISMIILAMAAVLAMASGIASGKDENTLTVIPDQVRIGTFYHGARIMVKADVKPSDEAVIVLHGDNKEVTLNKRGRVAIIWMNVAKITVDGIPQVYLMAATNALENICGKKTRDDLMLGTESLRPQVKISSDKDLTGMEFDQFRELKIHEGTYNTDNEVNIKPISSDMDEVTATLPISSKIPPGNYKISLYCFKGGVPIEERTSEFRIERGGLPKFMINLATNHPALYGLFAVVIAMAIGLMMGYLFNAMPGKRR